MQAKRMFKTIFLKTLYEKRWTTCWWALSGFLFALLIAAFFHTMSQSLGESLKNVPESMQGLIGDAHAYKTYMGYIDIQLFEQMIFLPVALGIIVGTGLIAGEEGDGTLQTLLAHPVSRRTVYMHKAAALSVIVGAVCCCLGVGAGIGGLVINESFNVGYVAIATAGLWLVSMVCALLGFVLGASTGKRGLAGAIAGLIAFATYVISSIVAGVSSLRWLDYLSPFHYFDHTALMSGHVAPGSLAVLVITAAALLIIGLALFSKRDIYPH
jgi:ABC-2 type transport system permease protein